MATFDPIFYSYVPTAPRCKSATAQHVPAQHVPAQKQSSIPDKIQCVKPNDTLFDNIRQVAVAAVSADDDPGYRPEIRGTTTVYSGNNNENNKEDDKNRELPTTEELQYTALRTKDIVPEDSSPDNTTRGDEDIALSKRNNDCLWMKEITDSSSSKEVLIERHRNSRGTQDRPLVLADDESDIPNLQVASISTSAYLFDHEKFWDVEEGDFEKEDPLPKQDLLATAPDLDHSHPYQQSIGSSQNHINLLDNNDGKQSASDMASPHTLLTILDENGEERENKDISENGTDLLLAFEKQEKSVTVLGSSYSHPHFIELSQLHNDPEHDRSGISQSGSGELGDSSSPQQDHDDDQPKQQQHEEVPEEAVWEDDNNHHMMNRGKRKRRYQDETDESCPFEHNIPDTNSIDDNNPQPAKRRKPQPLPLDDASGPVSKYNPKSRLRQRHSRSLPLTTQHKMKNRQSRNDCSYTSQTFRSSCDMIETVLMAEYQEWPFQGLLKYAILGNETTYKITLQANM
ncbi:hypothetical protein CJF32_00007237 [Rutstroemia sp. NJR-2017a WRK4]|nr:hypothetical protein CJF32_00007237 [Rutstroemia sp. NJR-2017a WRK4]